MALAVRAARPDEAAAILALWRDADTAPSVGEDVPSIHALLRRAPDGLLVADDDGALVGSLIARDDGWRGNLYRLAVLPSHRRRGIARGLVAAGEAGLRAAGCRRITALVLHTEEHAVGFWVAAGYEPDPRVTRFVRNLDP